MPDMETEMYDLLLVGGLGRNARAQTEKPTGPCFVCGDDVVGKDDSRRSVIQTHGNLSAYFLINSQLAKETLNRKEYKRLERTFGRTRRVQGPVWPELAGLGLGKLGRCHSNGEIEDPA